MSPTCDRPAKWSATVQGWCPTVSRCTCCPSTKCAAVAGEAPHETAFQKMMSEKPDDEDVAVAAAPIHDRGVPAVPDPRRCATCCAASHFATRRRAAGDRSLLRRQGQNRLHRGDRARCRSVSTATLIMADFLRSNAAVPQPAGTASSSRCATGPRRTRYVTFAEARLTDEVLGVREDYLDASRRSIEQNYGSLAGYLDAAGVTTGDVARVRAALLG